MEITPDQIRAARALLRLDQAELAERARVSVITIRRLEGAQRGERVTAGLLADVREALEQAGAEFIPDGIRRRRTARADAHALYEDLRAISFESAERLQGPGLLTEVELYGDDGLPA